ncbi:hypothetical protein BGZ83_002420, partial [Gryganskiella cystojenkinii]
IVPHRIEHCPGVTLDVVLFATAESVRADLSKALSEYHTTGLVDTPTDTSVDTHHPGAANKDVNIHPRLGCATTLAKCDSGYTIPHERITELDSSESLHLGLIRKSTAQIQADMKAMITRNRAGEELGISIIEEQLPVEHCRCVAGPETLDKILNQGQAILNQGAITQQVAREVLKLQKQMNDRLILIQSKTEAILTQNYELLEYTIPRLFIVLPETTTSWDSVAMFRTKFRLRFICECGEHTRVTGSKIPHHLHLANHEGYLINKPTEFFEKYGPFLILMLEMIKLGTNIAGHVVPTLASLVVVDVLNSAQSMINSVTPKVIEGVDYSLKYLEENRALIQKSDNVEVENERSSNQDLASYLCGVEGLEGVDLRQLGSYLTANSSDNLLGNLYRMTTESGHVKWVCHDHYRAGYQEVLTQKLRDIVKLNSGMFDEQMARVQITLKSSFAAAEFYAALYRAKGILDLDVSLQWSQGQADFDKLKGMISKSNIRLIKVDLHHETGPNINIKFGTIRRYDPIFDIMWLPSIQSFQVDGVPKHFFRRTSPLPKKADLSNLRCLGFIKLDPGYALEDSDIVKLKLLITRAPTLTTLTLRCNSIGRSGAQSLAEALKTNSNLTTLNMGLNSIGDYGAQVLSEVFKINSTLTTLDLSDNNIGDNGARALSAALKTLTTLNLSNNKIGDSGAQALSLALKTLTNLNLSNNKIGDSGAQALSLALKTNSTLFTLNVEENKIGFAGALALVLARKIIPTPAAFNLDKNLIEEKVVRTLHDALHTNSTLTNLDLSSHSIRDNRAQVLAEVLKTNSSLTTLRLQFNLISPIGGQALGEALKTNSTLTTLNLLSNSIGPIGGQALGEALKTNSTLTTLHLYNNSIGDIGCKALAEALKFNSTLTTLYLETNSIGDVGGQALGEALKTNWALTTLCLKSNWIGPIGGQALGEALKANSTLTTLYLAANSMGKVGDQALREALKTNSTCKIDLPRFFMDLKK